MAITDAATLGSLSAQVATRHFLTAPAALQLFTAAVAFHYALHRLPASLSAWNHRPAALYHPLPDRVCFRPLAARDPALPAAAARVASFGLTLDGCPVPPAAVTTRRLAAFASPAGGEREEEAAAGGGGAAGSGGGEMCLHFAEPVPSCDRVLAPLNP